MTTHPYQEISDLSQLPAPDETGIVSHYVFQYLDFFKVPQYLAAGHRYSDCCFLGCEIPSEMEGNIGRTCLLPDLPPHGPLLQCIPEPAVYGGRPV